MHVVVHDDLVERHSPRISRRIGHARLEQEQMPGVASHRPSRQRRRHALRLQPVASRVLYEALCVCRQRLERNHRVAAPRDGGDGPIRAAHIHYEQPSLLIHFVPEQRRLHVAVPRLL